MLAAVNWGGQGLHPRGGYAGFEQAASEQKWLEVHGLEHWTHFYTAYGLDLQRRFFDHFLKGEDNGWQDQPPVLLQVRHVDRFEPRAEQEWPLARTQWTKLYLDLDNGRLTWEEPEQPGSRSFKAMEEKVTLVTEPFERETEITGPLAAKLFAASSTADADLFLVVHLFDPDGNEVTFPGTVDPHTPIGQGWLRASHRKLDPERSRPFQPYHPHDEVEPLEPEKTYELDIEILPTCIVVPSGYRLGLSVRGTDYEYEGGELGDRAHLSTFANVMKGSGPFVHDDPVTRPPEIYGGTTTIHSGGANASYLLLPIIDGD
jgi:predicted acyl esterase